MESMDFEPFLITDNVSAKRAKEYFNLDCLAFKLWYSVLFEYVPPEYDVL
jgi:hypothetical protein